MNVTARYFDGKTAISHDVVVFVTSESLMIQQKVGKKMLTRWDIQGTHIITRAISTSAGVFGYGDTDERLIIEDILDWKEISRRLPRMANKASWISFHPVSLLIMTLVSITIVTGLYEVHPILTNTLAKNVPETWENNIGEYVLESQFTNICASSQGEDTSKILETLKDALVPEKELTVYVNDTKEMNALALPGKNIVILKGLITKAKSQEELFGVLAHEIGHIEHRHAINGIVNNLGISLAISTMFGDSKSAEMLSAYKMLSYSRDHEYESDEFAVKALIDADIDPRGLVSFFKMIEELEGNMPQFLEMVSTHPATKERIARIEQMIKEQETKNHKYKKPLSKKEWKQLKAICKKEK